jgi:hypothetical protein
VPNASDVSQLDNLINQALGSGPVALVWLRIGVRLKICRVESSIQLERSCFLIGLQAEVNYEPAPLQLCDVSDPRGHQFSTGLAWMPSHDGVFLLVLPPESIAVAFQSLDQVYLASSLL